MPKLPNPAKHNGAVLEAALRRSPPSPVPYVQRAWYVYLAPGPEQRALLDEYGDWNHSGEVTFVLDRKPPELLVTRSKGGEQAEFKSAMRDCGFGKYEVTFV